MKIVQFRIEDYEAVGYYDGDTMIDLSAAASMMAALVPDLGEVGGLAFESVLSMLRTEGCCTPDIIGFMRDFVADHSLQGVLDVTGAQLIAPLPRPPRIIALGLNYAAHAAETGKQAPEAPIFFAKASTSVIGPEDPIICPKGAGRIDPEVELAVVIGRGGRNISRKRAPAHIAGYTILNDVTARDMQSRDMAASRPWFLSKSFDTFGPMGPCIALPDEIPQPVELDLTLRVNGEVRQQGNTRDLIFGIPELVHRISRYITLEPGDIISTGTPSGIAPIEPGDVVEAEVEGIGVLRNHVVAGR